MGEGEPRMGEGGAKGNICRGRNADRTSVKNEVVNKWEIKEEEEEEEVKVWM